VISIPRKVLLLSRDGRDGMDGLRHSYLGVSHSGDGAVMQSYDWREVNADE